MTAQTRSVLKAVFETGDVPEGTNFANLIDSFLSLQDTDEQALSSKLKLGTLHATTEVSAALIKASAATISVITVSAFATVQATASVLNDQDGTQAVPGTAQGFITVEICGQTMAIPYFTVA